MSDYLRIEREAQCTEESLRFRAYQDWIRAQPRNIAGSEVWLAACEFEKQRLARAQRRPT